MLAAARLLIATTLFEAHKITVKRLCGNARKKIVLPELIADHATRATSAWLTAGLALMRVYGAISRARCCRRKAAEDARSHRGAPHDAAAPNSVNPRIASPDKGIREIASLDR